MHTNCFIRPWWHVYATTTWLSLSLKVTHGHLSLLAGILTPPALIGILVQLHQIVETLLHVKNLLTLSTSLTLPRCNCSPPEISLSWISLVTISQTLWKHARLYLVFSTITLCWSTRELGRRHQRSLLTRCTSGARHHGIICALRPGLSPSQTRKAV